MPTSFHIHRSILSPSEFVQYVNTYEHFECLDIGQEFVNSWLNNKQFYDQKTSGSTGKPAVHKIDRKNMLVSATRTASALKLFPGTKALICINMAYIGGKMMLARGLAFDWHLRIIPPCSFTRLNEIPEENFDFAAMVPLQLENLLASKKGITLLNNIKKIIVGGAATGPHLIEKLQGLKCEVYATYGMTETISHIALQTLNGADKSNFFQILPGVEHAVDDRNCLRIKADVTNHQWIQTNDSVVFNDQGDFKILGRADNVINTGGVKIQVEALEAKIAPLLKDKMTDFAITHKADQVLGEKVVLVCETSTISISEIIDLLKSTIDRFEVPKEVVLAPIPKTASGKIDRPALRQLAD